MDPSEGNFSRFNAPDPRNPRTENSTFHHMQNFPANNFNHSQYPQNSPSFIHSQYPQNSPPIHVMQNFHPFANVGNLQQHAQYPPSYQGFQQVPPFGVPGGLFGSVGGASSHGSDSASPQSQRKEVEQAQEREDSSGSSPNEVRRAVRINYAEEENLRLVSSWLKHSVDPIRGIDQSAESYWAIIRHPARLWDRKELEDIMMACIILHNMIIEDERDSYQLRHDDIYEEGRSTRPIIGLDHGPIHGFARILELNDIIHDRDAHKRLKADLVEHIWQKFGGGHQP